MDIAAAFPTKTPQRPDPVRAAAAAARDDRRPDDFATELDASNAERQAPAKSDKPDAPKAQAADAPAGETAKGETDTKADAAIVAADPAIAAILPAPVQTPAIAAAPDGAVPAAPQPPQPQTPVLPALPQAAPPLAQPQTQPHAQAPAGPDLTAAAAALLAAQKTAQTADAAAPPPAPTPAAQSMIPLTDGLAPPKLAASAPKKTGEPKTEAAAALQPPSQTPAPAPAAHAAAPVQPGSKAAAQQDGKDQPQGQGVPAAQAAAQAQTPAPQSTEFKLDAGAATAAMQPASPPAQNAAPAAPALVAQNAPVFVPPEALGVAIARKALEGTNKFELRLDPPELGRLDVSLEVDEAGNTRAHIRADRPEALELLQREAKGMEQALRQAGLTLDQSSLTFSLNGREGREAQEGHHHGRRAKFTAVLPEDEINAAAIRGAAPSANGLDLRV